MSTTTRKPPPPKGPDRNQTKSPYPASSPNPSKLSNAAVSAANGIGKATPSGGTSGTTGANISSRSSTRRSGPSMDTLNTSDAFVQSDANEDDARVETALVIEDLKSRLLKAETNSEDYKRELSSLQKRLDESEVEQGKLEDQMHEDQQRIKTIEIENREVSRQQREAETLFESERTAMLQESEEHNAREEELHSVIRRLKETVAQRDTQRSMGGETRHSRALSQRGLSSPTSEAGQFAPPSSLERSDSSSKRLVAQKDKIIESLRFELAEAQVKIVEIENMGGGRLQDLEKSLLETRMTNARLMEDNESFQLLLSEKTLSGDFTKTDLIYASSAHAGSEVPNSLAEELESAVEGESENYRKLEVETKSLREGNKALTLYIENIIGRLLQHKDFETILDKTPDLMSSIPKPQAANTEKDLPPPPPEKDEEPAPSILQRTRSIIAGPVRQSTRSRPMSQMVIPPQPAPQPTTANEDPAKAPSVPLDRSSSLRKESHRRAQSDMVNPAALVNQMYHGPPSAGSGGPMSPGISPNIIAPRSSFFVPSTASGNQIPAPVAARASSGSVAPNDKVSSSSNSFLSDHSGHSGDPEMPNPQRSNTFSGAVMTQNKLRPLRLVQQNREMESGNQGGATRLLEEEQAVRKKANRGSWMGWFNGAKEEPPAFAAPKKVGNESGVPF